MGRGISTALAVIIAGCTLGAASAGATEVSSTPLAALPNAAQKLTAYGGYVVFSQRDPDGKWSLMSWHAGSIKALDVPARSIPFDAEAGPGARGTPTVVFSKCAKDPPPARDDGGAVAVLEAEWSRSVGCRVYELSLPAGVPKLVAGIRPPRGASDATPAIWNGDIAFARHVGGLRSTRIYLWHHSTGALTQLGGGPTSCPITNSSSPEPACSKEERVASTWVESISLDPAGVTYEWFATIPRKPVGAFLEPEIRLDPLADGRQDAPTKSISSNFFRGTCGGGTNRSPNMAGGVVLYDITIFECEHGPNALFNRLDWYLSVNQNREATPSGRGVIVALAWDRGTAYWIRDVLPPEANCQAERSCEQLDRQTEDECEPGFAACGPLVFEGVRGCAPEEGTCTLMRATDLKPR
jgi:hypothetical protein